MRKRLPTRQMIEGAATLGICAALAVSATVACARAGRIAEETDASAMSEERQWYLAGLAGEERERFWQEVARAERETAEEAEAPYEEERSTAALLAAAEKIEGVRVTHYCICERCCGKAEGEAGYGITASGRAAAAGTSVAVDPNWIPLGSDIIVDYGDGVLHYYRADDTGAAVQGEKHIDLCVADHETALQLGRRTATMWVVRHER